MERCDQQYIAEAVAHIWAIRIFRCVTKTARTILPLLFLASNALASLGDSVADSRGDDRLCGDTKHASTFTGYKVIEFDRKDGSVIREYVNGAGQIFGVSWQTGRVPDMKTLLGGYFPEFQRAVQARGHRPGPMVLKTKNLVVESAGHMRAYFGRAYLTKLLPNSLTPTVVK